MKLIPIQLVGLTDQQKELTRKLVDKLRATNEKWHSLDATYLDLEDGTGKYDSTGIALRVAGVGVCDSTDARLKYDKLAACLDIDWEEEDLDGAMLRLYGWNKIVEVDGIERSLCYLDRRMRFAFDAIADTIAAALG